MSLKIYSTNGDFPVPPKHKLPTEIIGVLYFFDENIPTLNKVFLKNTEIP